ncbi:hypothetical protein FV225_29480, partial [Methylobacterium sp. WL93]
MREAAALFPPPEAGEGTLRSRGGEGSAASGEVAPPSPPLFFFMIGRPASSSLSYSPHASVVYYFPVGGLRGGPHRVIGLHSPD